MLWCREIHQNLPGCWFSLLRWQLQSHKNKRYQSKLIEKQNLLRLPELCYLKIAKHGGGHTVCLPMTPWSSTLDENCWTSLASNKNVFACFYLFLEAKCKVKGLSKHLETPRTFLCNLTNTIWNTRFGNSTYIIWNSSLNLNFYQRLKYFLFNTSLIPIT